MAVSSVLAKRAGEVQAVEAIKWFDIFARIAAVAATTYALQGRLRRRWEAVCYAYYNNIRNLRFQVLTAASMMFRAVFWVLIPDDGGSTHLWNVGRQLFYTAVYPRRQLWTSYSPSWELEISHNLTDLERTDSPLLLYPMVVLGFRIRCKLSEYTHKHVGLPGVLRKRSQASDAGEVKAVEATKWFDMFARIAAVAATACALQGRFRRRWEAVLCVL
jgi:hypothetical protein